MPEDYAISDSTDKMNAPKTSELPEDSEALESTSFSGRSELEAGQPLAQKIPCQTLETDLPYPDHPVPLDSILYIPRPPIEELAYQELIQPGCVIRIKAPKKIGKSSLMLRVLSYAKTLGYQTVNLDMNQVDAACLTNLDKFLRWFCTSVSWKLGLEPNLDEYWYDDIGSKLPLHALLRDISTGAC